MRREPLAERIPRRVQIDQVTGCWLWQGHLDRTGYGKVNELGTWYAAHRASYETFVGPIPEGLHLDHLCKVRHCVNPAHLEAVTPRENIRRSDSVVAINARKTHCGKGHAFDEENTYIWRGSRICRACRSSRSAKVRAPGADR